NILQAFRESKDLQWPPTADDMELTPENLLPTDLVRFLSMVMAGKEDMETNEKMKRLNFLEMQAEDGGGVVLNERRRDTKGGGQDYHSMP
ncbi:hypothetical protein JOQ06_026438, partial [Pogonophryne albipinna]